MTKTNSPQALWVTDVETAEIRDATLTNDASLVVVHTLFSGISRGTERLVFTGQVPPTEHDTMRAPFQEGAFTFPVKYGYAAVGIAKTGAMAGQTVFSLYPHQTRFAVPEDAILPVPAHVPPARAVLASNMETALNILWDANIQAGDRVVVVGAGVVGALAGYLCAKVPGTKVCLVDVNDGRSALAENLGCDFATPDGSPREADVVIHTSASSEGLAGAISAASTEATIVEASWYGTRETTVPLGAAFHRKRLRIVSSQVGRIPAQKTPRWTFRRRLSKALELLDDPVLDALISGESGFETLPEDYSKILNDPATLCHRIRYPQS